MNLGRALVQAGHPVDLVVADVRGKLTNQIPDGVRLVDLHCSRVITSLVPLAGYLRKERPLAVISFMDHANIVALLARMMGNRATRVVATVHNTLSVATASSNNRRSKLLPALIRLVYPLADRMVAVSQGAADDLMRITGLTGVEVIYNPVITPDLLAARQAAPPHPWLEEGQPPVILGVGRLTPQKDFPTLVRAFALVRRQRPARLIIIGEGDTSELEGLARQLGVGSDVLLAGYQPGVPAFMARAAVFVLSSAWEGLPTVLIEALALSRNIVSTDCPSGPREILQDGRLGRLVPMRDPEKLSEAIIASLDQPGTRASDDVLAPFTETVAVQRYLEASGYPGLSGSPELSIHLQGRESPQSYVDYEGV
jgi:glycosyltransferase involved in cell wall biosynthesis